MTALDGHCVIVGASHAGAQLAISLRREGWRGAITLIGDEPGLPYQRPPLSKAALLATQPTPADIYSREVYLKAGISLCPNTRVVSVNRASKQLLLASGESLSYDKLALCTGARIRELSIPGADLPGVHYLRNEADARGIHAQARTGGHAVVVGAGYIGLEVAAALRQLGMRITLLVRGARILEHLSAPPMAEHLSRLHRERGVVIRTQVQPVAILGRERVEQVQCSDGSLLTADMLVLGIGVQPNQELAQAAGLLVGDGIVVDDCAQTSDPDIVSAGDCAFHPNDMLGVSLRLESVPNATEQAKSAAASLCGVHKPYCALPWFWSEQYDSRLQIAGLGRGYERLVVEDDAQANRLVVWYIHDERIIAVDCLNAPGIFMRARKLVAARAPASALVTEAVA
ncbi:FAD-dependent oxidoreductase [Pseudomonas chengduensis]|nr:FAD-dependent oxidoreductase [Pseudomonas chengduensis]MDH1867412.1 FAD-dependent oxidoreductase [Pseudomonas chengduensis]